MAFTASVRVSDEHYHLGPFDKYTTVVYKKVTTNIGEAYNPDTGIYPLDKYFSIILKMQSVTSFCVKRCPALVN